jgi:hypothetical protein
MKLGDLKKSMAKLPPDMDDMEVAVVVAREGKKQYEPLCFTGYMPLPGHEFIVLGALTAVQKMVKDGEMPRPKGYIDPDDSDPLLFNEGN